VHSELGPLTLLAEIPVERLRAQSDVRALDALDAADIAALEAFCRTGSLRQAAVVLHRHHTARSPLGWPMSKTRWASGSTTQAIGSAPGSRCSPAASPAEVDRSADLHAQRLGRVQPSLRRSLAC
jgi:hypothetical protein